MLAAVVDVGVADAAVMELNRDVLWAQRAPLELHHLVRTRGGVERHSLGRVGPISVALLHGARGRLRRGRLQQASRACACCGHDGRLDESTPARVCAFVSSRIVPCLLIFDLGAHGSLLTFPHDSFPTKVHSSCTVGRSKISLMSTSAGCSMA